MTRKGMACERNRQVSLGRILVKNRRQEKDTGAGKGTKGKGSGTVLGFCLEVKEHGSTQLESSFRLFQAKPICFPRKQLEYSC